MDTRTWSPPDPTLFASISESLLISDESVAMARHSQLSNLQTSSHGRNQSVPSFPSPVDSPRTTQQSRGLAKLTLVERLSRDSIPSPIAGDNSCTVSPRSI